MVKDWTGEDAAGKVRGELGLPEQTGSQRPAPCPAEEPVSKPASGKKQKRLSTWLDRRQKQERHRSPALSATWEACFGSYLFQCSVLSSLLGGAQAIGASGQGEWLVSWALPSHLRDVGWPTPWLTNGLTGGDWRLPYA